MNSAQRILNGQAHAGSATARRRRAHALYDPWRRFWFTPADPTPLAVMRILFGGMLLYTQFVWGLNLEGFVGADGWQSSTLVRTLQSDQFAWSFWWWVPHGLHFTAHLVVSGHSGAVHAGCLHAGDVGLGVFDHDLVLQPGADGQLRPRSDQRTGAPLSGDRSERSAACRLIAGACGYRAARKQFALGREPVVAPVEPSARANLALRLVQVHLCVIYVFACLSKLQGESWWNGTAIWQAVSNLEYQSRDVTWLAWYPWLVNLLTHVTIAWEMTFWALVWRPHASPVRARCRNRDSPGDRRLYGNVDVWTGGDLRLRGLYPGPPNLGHLAPRCSVDGADSCGRSTPCPIRQRASARGGLVRARARHWCSRTDRSRTGRRSPSITGERAPSLVPTPVVAEVVPSPSHARASNDVAPLNGKSRGRADLLPTRPSRAVDRRPLEAAGRNAGVFSQARFSLLGRLRAASSPVDVGGDRFRCFGRHLVLVSRARAGRVPRRLDRRRPGVASERTFSRLSSGTERRSRPSRIPATSRARRQFEPARVAAPGARSPGTDGGVASPVRRPAHSLEKRPASRRPRPPSTVEASQSPQPATHDSPSVSDGNGSPS